MAETQIHSSKMNSLTSQVRFTSLPIFIRHGHYVDTYENWKGQRGYLKKKPLSANYLLERAFSYKHDLLWVKSIRTRKQSRGITMIKFLASFLERITENSKIWIPSKRRSQKRKSFFSSVKKKTKLKRQNEKQSQNSYRESYLVRSLQKTTISKGPIRDIMNLMDTPFTLLFLKTKKPI